MSTKWHDVPRDPVMDDDELEAMYQLAEMHKPPRPADLSKHMDTRLSKTKSARGSEERAAPAA